MLMVVKLKRLTQSIALIIIVQGITQYILLSTSVIYSSGYTIDGLNLAFLIGLEERRTNNVTSTRKLKKKHNVFKQ